MKYSSLRTAALAAFTVFFGIQTRADNMASIAITPATGVVTLSPQWAVGPGLSGFHHMAQDLSLGGGANQFYSIKGSAIPAGGDITAFTRYIAASGAATNHNDIGSKLRPNAYSALTSADPDLGFGSVQFYFIHHKNDGDYLSHIVPSSGTASAVTDLKPMSQPGGPATGGLSGYFGLTFAASNLGYGLNMFYYLRTDPVTGFTRFGSIVPALAGASSDLFNLGVAGYKALAFTGSDVGYGVDKMYYLRLDPVTNFTILGTLHPTTGKTSDIANLGSVYSTLTYVPGDVGFGVGRFYTTGSVNPTWQSVSFAAIADRAVTAGPFTVSPSASSNLPIVLTVVPGSTGAATISGPVGGVFTVTPTAPGVINLQATQSGQVSPAFEFNMLRQSFTATGVGTVPIISNSPLTAPGTIGSPFNFGITASGSPTVYSASPLPAGLVVSTTTGVISGSPTTAGTTLVLLGATNGSGTGNATLTITVAAAGAAPIITNNPLSAAGTVGSPFSFTTTASGSPASFTGTPLPAGLSIATATGIITGTPTTAGNTQVLLGATNGAGTGNATLSITVAPAGVAPIVSNNPLTAAGTVGTPFGFTITASGSPTSFSAGPLPAGLSVVATTGVITGVPTTVGITPVLLTASNSTGTGIATLTITVAAAAVAPIITNNPLTAAGTVESPFSFTITASGLPTSYAASGLPPGLSIVAATGVITGIPTTAGVFATQLSASNSTGVGSVAIRITVAPKAIAPIIANDTVSAAGSAGFPFNYTVVASGLPTSYSATGLPVGLQINPVTGVISGSPTFPGTSVITVRATNALGTDSATLTLTVGLANSFPIIVSPTTAPGTAGVPFVTYVIAATGLPTQFTAVGLPPGLVLNSLTGAISGTPTVNGTYIVTLTAVNAAGTSFPAPLTITVGAPNVLPIITSPTIATASLGSPFVTYLIAATGLPTTYSATGLPAGLTLNTLTGAINGTPTATGTFLVTITATSSQGTSIPATVSITVAPAGVGPIITSPITATGAAGTAIAPYAIVATGLPTTYTATGLPAGLVFNPVTGIISGTPTISGTFPITLSATNANGTTVSSVILTVTGPVPAASSRIVNFSARALSGPGNQTLITGFVVAGENKNLLVRAAGPALTAFGVTNALADPLLTLYGTSGATIASNDDWQINSAGQVGGALIAATSSRVGAFALSNGSKDAAMLQTVGSGAHTTSLVRANSTTGVALTELYDLDGSATSRLINVSARMNVSPGEGTLIAGLVISGNAPKTVLIRAVGPGLAPFGVTDMLADPQIVVFSGSARTAANDDWSTGSTSAVEISAMAAKVGAFALVNGSKDAALILTLQPGSYTMQVIGAANTSGVALVEVYDTQ